MARYTFALGTIFDPAQAIEDLADDEAARVHAGIVAEELNRNRHQPLVLLVLDENGQIICRLPPRGRLTSVNGGAGRALASRMDSGACFRPAASVIVPRDLLIGRQAVRKRHLGRGEPDQLQPDAPCAALQQAFSVLQA
jgi:hypothetical protein